MTAPPDPRRMTAAEFCAVLESFVEHNLAHPDNANLAWLADQVRPLLRRARMVRDNDTEGLLDELRREARRRERNANFKNRP